jgi:hypothetical protein
MASSFLERLPGKGAGPLALPLSTDVLMQRRCQKEKARLMWRAFHPRGQYFPARTGFEGRKFENL